MSFKITEITINEMQQPLGIDINKPLFSWKFQSTEKEMKQKKYQIIITNSVDENIFWDSGIIENDISINKEYDGKKLLSETKYDVSITVWNQNNEKTESKTFFETGFLKSTIDAWEGSKWIGAPELSLSSETISVFVLESLITLEKGKAGIIFGANDKRLLDANKNEMGVSSENYISYVINKETSPATIEIYRVGYDKNDKADIPFATFPIVNLETGESIEVDNKPHKLAIEVTGNCAYTYFDGIKIDEIEENFLHFKVKSPRQLNPLGNNDVTTYPRLCDIGYYVDDNSKVKFEGITVKHFREPKNEIVNFDKKGRTFDSKTFETFNPSTHSVPMLRYDFDVNKKVKSARLYATARGIYECSINGKRIGDEYFAPGASHFDKHLMYQTYDITNQLQEGFNAIGCMLASGWWCESYSFVLTNYNYWGEQPSFLGKIVINYEDGTREVINTNTFWQYFGEGPYIHSSFFNGEKFDARKKYIYENFSKPNFEADGVRYVSEIKPTPIKETPSKMEFMPKWPEVNFTEPKIVGNYQAPVREVELLTAKTMFEPRKNVFIYDLKQEIAGIPVIKFNEKSGTEITIRYGEVLYPELEEYGDLAGMMLQANLREASNTDIYICSGEKDEIFKPKFTFHGYRYIEITGISKPLKLEDVQSILLSSVEKITGEFECSNDLVNKFVSNVGYSQRGNFISIPTDCPQRNERMGWVGDTHVFCKTATYQSRVKNFYIRNLEAIRDLQSEDGRLPNIAPFGGGFGGVTYESGSILMIWELYQQYGDVTIIKDYYEMMKKWFSAIEKIGLPGEPSGFMLGDWLAPDETDNFLIWNAFHFRNATLMCKYAKILDKKEDVLEFEKIAENTKKYWNENFVDEQGRTKGDTQGSYAIALMCDVFNDEYKKTAFENLARKTKECDCTVRTGFFGTGPLNSMLSLGGFEDLSHNLITQTKNPSWLYPVTQGATTIWERWDSFTFEKGFGGNNSMNSFNHYSLGSVLSWLYENILGIKRNEEFIAYKKFTIKPEVNGFDYAKGGIETPYGRIESSWKKEDGKIIYTFKIPANTTAILDLQGSKEKIEVGCGEYTFKL